MDIIIIVTFLLLGILLLLVEVFLIPGTTIAGVGGTIFFIGAIIYAFNISSIYGIYSMILSFLILGIAIYYFVKSKTLDKLSLHAEIDGKIDPLKDSKVKIGDKGISVSRLAPVGKVRIHNTVLDAKSVNEYIDAGVEIEVIQINRTNIDVKTISKD
jgi:membrane-bound ClpP family serine protease